jgi:hypothetical protein
VRYAQRYEVLTNEYRQGGPLDPLSLWERVRVRVSLPRETPSTQKHTTNPLIVVCLLLFAFCATPASAHHILGVPHYAYDEAYPQTPVLTYAVNAGPNEVKMTGYPGKPKPGERCALHVYIRDMEAGQPFDGDVSLSVMKDNLIGRDPVIYGPMQAPLEEAMYKFYPRFADEANYLVRIEYEIEGVPWTIDLPMVVGTPGSPWAVLGVLVGGVVLFLVVIRAIRIKRRRRLKIAVPTATSGEPVVSPSLEEESVVS